MFGLTLDKLFIICIIAAVLVGPKQLPRYAAQLATFVRGVRSFVAEAKARATEELGPEFDPAEWKRLDPRQFDPRRIVREALVDEPATVHEPVVEELVIEAPGVETSFGAASDVDPPADVDPRPAVAPGGWQEALLARVPAPRGNEMPSAARTAETSPGTGA